MERTKSSGVLFCIVVLSMLQVVISQTPTVTVSQSTYSAIPGSSITLSCTVTTTGTINTLFWLRERAGAITTITNNGGRYTGVTTSNPSLTISGLSNDDTGSYTCYASITATGNFGRSDPTYLTVATVNAAPVAQNPLASYTMTSGQLSVTLGCVISANPAATSVTWSKTSGTNPTTIPTGTTKYTNGNTATPSLTINQLSLSDTGTYVCSATNAFGSSQSTGTSLIGEPTVSIGQNTYSSTSGGGVTLVCNVNPNGGTLTDVVWEELVNGVYQTVSISTNTRYTGGTTGTPSLTFSDSQPSDSGTYRCKATNQVGTGTSGTTQLTVTASPPTVIISQNTYSITEGSSVILGCTVIPNGVLTDIVWEKLANGVYQTVPVSTTTRYTDGTTGTPSLSISNSQTSDGGTYRCRATNQYGTTNGADIQLTVATQTLTVTVSQPTYEATPGSSVTLVCTISPAGTISTLFWLRDRAGSMTTITNNGVKYTGVTTSNPSLTISGLSNDDTGSYTCYASATTTGDIKQSDPTYLTVAAVNAAPVAQNPLTSYTMTTGQLSVTLGCVISANPAATSVTWSKTSGTNPTTIPTGTTKYTNGNTATPSLTINQLSLSDTGTYVCSATNAFGSSQSTGTTLIGEPTVSIGQNTYSSTSGGGVTLVCNVNPNGGTLSDVIWEELVNGVYQTVSISTNTRYTGGSTATPSLTISDSQPSDSGTYRCKATNQVGTGTSGTTQLTVTATAPTVIISQNTYSTIEGSSVTLGCTVIPNGVLTNLVWEKLANGVYQTVPVSTTTRYTDGTTGTPSLSISNSQTSDSGTYRCTVTNQYGTTNGADIQLTVAAQTLTVTVSQPTYAATPGSSVTLVCTVSPAGTISTLFWLRDRAGSMTTITNNGVKYTGVTTSNPSLTISGLSYDDTGSYTCYASSTTTGETKQSDPTYLTVATTNAAPVAQNPLASYTMTTGQLSVTLGCVISANPATTSVTWSKTSGTNPTTIPTGTTKYTNGNTATPSLTINQLSLSDTGTYVCSATNAFGSSQSAGTTLMGLPTVTIGSSAYSGTIGGSVNLVCNVNPNGGTLSGVVWEKLVNGVYETVTINTNSRYTGGTTTTPSLSISNVQPSDSGTYRCTATNQVGSGTSGTTQLTAVPGTAPVLFVQQTTQQVFIGNDAVLQCSIVSADPNVQNVFWTFTPSGGTQPTTLTIDNTNYAGPTNTDPTLRVITANAVDSGSYVCHATNTAGTGNSETITLVVGNVPTVVIGQNSYSVTTGESVTLQCTVTGTPAHTDVVWEKLESGVFQTVLINTNSRYTDGTRTIPSLTISNSHPTDSGTYRCKATNQFGTGTSGSTVLAVTGNLPVVSIQLPTYSGVIGSSITIPCSVASDPPHTSARWQFTVNGQDVTVESATSSGRYSVGPLNAPDLTINGLVSTDQSVYTCVAVNSVGPGQDTATLLVTGSVPVVTIPQSGYSVQTGSAITIPCNIVATPAVTGVAWKKVQGTQSTPINVDGQLYSGGNTSTPALTIPSADRQTHEGFYECTATNAAGEGKSSTIFLVVTGAKPIVDVPQTTVTAVIGTSVTLQCVVNADPVATVVEWTKIGSTTPISGVGSSKYFGGTPANPSLTITSIESADAGGYVCSATNSVGQGTGDQITLIVSGSAPTVTVSQTTYEVIKGSSVSIQCSATGLPAVTSVYWEKVANNGQTTQLTISTGRFTVSNPSLSIFNADSSSDTGTYTCIATNAAGTTRSNQVTVVVTGDVPTAVIGSPTYIAVAGTQAILVCTVTASPAASLIQWSKVTTSGNVDITVDGTKYQDGTPAKPSLVINTVSENDEGTYVCRATNVVGTGTSAQTVLTVTGSVPNVQVTQASYSVTKGGNITLECLVSGLPAATSVSWKRTSGGTETLVPISIAKYSGSTPATPSLTITGAESVDAATYVCTANNSVGVGRSSQTSLSVTGDIPTVTVPSPTHSTISGTSVTLTCVVSASPPATSVKWKKIVNTVSTDINVTLAAYDGGTVGNPSLTIVIARPVDIADYICTATNSVGTGESGRTSLTVTGAVPTVSIPVPSYSVLTGKSVEIICNVVANPPAGSISWNKTVGNVSSVLNIDNNKFTGGTIQIPSLTINTAAANDQASYTCTATNVVGSATSNAAVLLVTGARPAVVIENPDITAVLGSSVTIRCTVTANPTPTGITWERIIGGVTTPVTINARFVGSTVANPSLTINNITTGDQGNYVCVAQNEVGTARSAPGKLTVTGNVPSVVISKPSFSVVTGEDITIDCDYTASPAATGLQWKKIVNTVATDILLTGSAKYSGGTLSSPSLVIKSAAAGDQAFYQCVVTNSVGEGMSTTAYLFVTGDTPTATVTQTNYNIDLEQNVTLRCNVDGVPAVQSVTWTVTKPPSTAQIPVIINPPRYSGGSLTTPSLTITRTTLDDQGIYVCKATNILGTGESENVYLNVLGTKPVVSVPVSIYTADRGGRAVLTCSIIASPNVTRVYWTRSVQNVVTTITAASPKYEGSIPSKPSLTINTLESGDEGSYRCHATNSVGTSQSELTSLIVSVSPTNIIVDPASVTRREGLDFSSVCTAEANPPATYRWVKENSQQVLSTVQTLTMLNLDRSQGGRYVCIATNSRGSASATLTVDVQYKPLSIVPTVDQTVIIGMNDPRTLTCDTIANPPVETYRWTKDNSDIAGATGLTHVVTVRSQNDYGTYTCYATNAVGQSLAIDFILQSGTITTQPPVVLPDLTTETIIAIAVAAAVLLLLVVILLVCCCARDPKPKVQKVYTKRPSPTPVPLMMPPPVVMSDPSMALVPVNGSLRRSYDNSYPLNRSELPAQEYTYYESERGRKPKSRPSSFVNYNGE